MRDRATLPELAEHNRDGAVGEMFKVVQAIVERRAVSWAAFERLREEKRSARGGFAGRWLLVSVSE